MLRFWKDSNLLVRYNYLFLTESYKILPFSEVQNVIGDNIGGGGGFGPSNVISSADFLRFAKKEEYLSSRKFLRTSLNSSSTILGTRPYFTLYITSDNLKFSIQ